eukprot:gnl/TRDRNA2_/TRDRNA2_165867_c0_seq1.p1 gnl/TRDRNA2_/TRDRNA2_165867_c0~~gnl/TRDRNA2_/TRDRNA2_165867_c0_seq1.p1  ORF type:complete len:158 (+),score=3.30 gnl/TRDRNA2_/TRDRNA2_165867_c0_seq1:131-604(+)
MYPVFRVWRCFMGILLNVMLGCEISLLGFQWATMQPILLVLGIFLMFMNFPPGLSASLDSYHDRRCRICTFSLLQECLLICTSYFASFRAMLTDPAASRYWHSWIVFAEIGTFLYFSCLVMRCVTCMCRCICCRTCGYCSRRSVLIVELDDEEKKMT